MLLDITKLEWASELMALFGLGERVLPALCPSSGVVGEIDAAWLGTTVPIAGIAGDQQAALFGQQCFERGLAKNTYGTGSSLMTPVPTPVASRHGLSTTVAWALPSGTTYALEGNITVTGGAVQWLATLLGCPGGPADVAALARTVDDAGGVYLVPALAGLGAPYWDAGARGLLCGATRGTTAAHVARATIDSIAYQVRDVFDAMRSDGAAPAVMLADGGASRNAELMQFQADILGCPVVRSDSAELSARGAAWLAGLAVGVWPSVAALAALPRAATRFEPRMGDGERDRRYAGWQEAVARARSRGGE
jgi:glycerol kinase